MSEQDYELERLQQRITHLERALHELLAGFRGVNFGDYPLARTAYERAFDVLGLGALRRQARLAAGRKKRDGQKKDNPQ